MKLKTKIKLSSEQFTKLALECAIRNVQPNKIIETAIEYFLSDTEYSFESWLTEHIPIDNNAFLRYLLDHEILEEYFNTMLNYERTVASLKEHRIDTLVATPEWKTVYDTKDGFYKSEEEYLKSEKETYESEIETMNDLYESLMDMWHGYVTEAGLPVTDIPAPNSDQAKLHSNYHLYKCILENFKGK